HQRGVHAVSGGDRRGARGGRRVRRQSRQGHGRHRRGGGRPPPPPTRPPAARTGGGGGGPARTRGGGRPPATRLTPRTNRASLPPCACYFFFPYTAFGSNVLSPSRNSSITAPALPSGTAR